MTIKTPLDLLEEIELRSDVFGDDGACPISIEAGSNRRVLLVTGENGGGKSLFTKAIATSARRQNKPSDKDFEVMSIGMELRTTSGIQRAFLFGDEGTDSTGKISIGTVLAGLRTIEARNNPHWLILDEPDVGVGEGYRRALGELLAQVSGDLPDQTFGLVIVTHSREIASPLIAAGATSVRVGEDRRPIREWIEKGDLPKSIEDLKSLGDRTVERFKAITNALREPLPTASHGPTR